MQYSIELLEQEYCSQGDTSGIHKPKMYFYKGKDCYLYDKDDTAYLDMQMCNSSVNFGYQNKVFHKRFTQQAQTLPSLAGEYLHENKVILATRISLYMEETYGIKGRVHFTVGGAQAVDDALKLCANKSGIRSMFTFEGGYHGRTMAASSVSSSYRYKRQFGGVIDTYRIPFPYCYRCAYNQKKDICNLYCLDYFSERFESELCGVYDTRNGACGYAGFLAEPLLGRGGYLSPPAGYFQKLNVILKKYDIPLVMDEVQMGLYRTGKLWGFENYGIVPDLIIFGKSITNGLWPLSGVWAREKYISPELWPTGSTHATYANHPIGIALGLETFELISRTDFQNKNRESGNYFKFILTSLKNDYNCIGFMQCTGHAANLEIIDPKTKKPDPDKAEMLIDRALREQISYKGRKTGLVLTRGGFFNNCIMLSPSVLINKQDLDCFNDLIRYYLDRLKLS